MEFNEFEKELQEWMKTTLNPYCLGECKISCCDCEGIIQIDKGYEHLFKKYRLTGRKIPVKKPNSPGDHLFKNKNNDLWYFCGKTCPNYDPKDKKCLIHNEYKRCAIYPLMEAENKEDGYMLFSLCSLHKMKETEEPLKSLINLCKKHGLRLFKEGVNKS